jgi:hypothetical protein
LDLDLDLDLERHDVDRPQADFVGLSLDGLSDAQLLVCVSYLQQSVDSLLDSAWSGLEGELTCVSTLRAIQLVVERRAGLSAQIQRAIDDLLVAILPALSLPLFDSLRLPTTHRINVSAAPTNQMLASLIAQLISSIPIRPALACLFTADGGEKDIFASILSLLASPHPQVSASIFQVHLELHETMNRTLYFVDNSHFCRCSLCWRFYAIAVSLSSWIRRLFLSRRVKTRPTVPLALQFIFRQSSRPRPPRPPRPP